MSYSESNPIVAYAIQHRCKNIGYIMAHPGAEYKFDRTRHLGKCKTALFFPNYKLFITLAVCFLFVWSCIVLVCFLTVNFLSPSPCFGVGCDPNVIKVHYTLNI